jgi:hypothetical protein
MVQACLGKKCDPISKTTKAIRARGVAQIAEHLPIKYEALILNPDTTNG